MRKLFAGFLTVLVACGPSLNGSDDGRDDDNDGDSDNDSADSDSDGDSDSDSDSDSADSDESLDTTDAMEPDAAMCGAQMTNIGVVNLGDPPDLLVLLDRSGSMMEPLITFPPTQPPWPIKWDVMEDALEGVTTAKDDQIKFGLMDFPSDNNCSADSVAEVGIMLGSAPLFQSYFNTRSPNGNTPAHLGLAAALTYYQGQPVNPAGRYVLFATDGLPNCNGGDPEMASDAETVAAVTALFNAGIPTYVLGFGSFGGGTILNQAAVAGGRPRPGSTKFYEANDAASLDAALQAISGGIIVPSCSFALDAVPPVPDDVTVTLNGMVVPRSPSHANGWDYHPDAMTITFFGTYCEQIEMGASTDVSFAYGCPGPIVQ
jgi:hypothetical protein